MPKDGDKPTARFIQHRLWICFHGTYRLFLPNYTPRDWWECDMFGVTKAGYFHEYEVKLTVGDFRADAEKQRKNWAVRFDHPLRVQKKHEQLAARSVKGPSLFWYVAPEGVIPPEAIPEWAGFKEFTRNRFWRTVKEAPRLHRQKVDDQISRHALSVCYHRYWHERQQVDDLRREVAARPIAG